MKSIVLNSIVVKSFVELSACALLAACASQPNSEAPAVKANAAPTTVATAKTDEKLTADKLIALQKEGYKLVDRDGQTLYCRTEKKTGSQIARETVCMTEKEVDDLRNLTQRRMGDVVRQLPPPQGK